MYERFTDRARNILKIANGLAQRLGHNAIDAPHLFAALFQEAGIGSQGVKQCLAEEVFLQKMKEVMPAGSPTEPIDDVRLPQTHAAKYAIEKAMDEARRLHHNYVGTEHMALGLLHQQTTGGFLSPAVRSNPVLTILKKLECPPEKIREAVLTLMLNAGDRVPEPIRAALSEAFDRFGPELAELAQLPGALTITLSPEAERMLAELQKYFELPTNEAAAEKAITVTHRLVLAGVFKEDEEKIADLLENIRKYRRTLKSNSQSPEGDQS